MRQEIVIEIDRDGKGISMETRGMPGRECLETTRFLEETLGRITSRSLKAEYFLGAGKAGARIRVRRLPGDEPPECPG